MNVKTSSVVIASAMVVLLSRASPARTDGTQGAAFLNIPVGGAPAAMGSAYSALAHDAYAPVWNPGGLGFAEGTELAGQHLPYLESMRYEFASLTHRIKEGRSVGVSVQYLGTGDMEELDPQGRTTGEFSSYYASYAAAYGHALTPQLSLGIAGKMIQAKLADVGARAWAADVGAMYRLSKRIQLAAVASNLGSKLTFLEQSDDLPLTGRLGLAYQHSNALLFSAEGVVPKSGLAGAHVGAEWSPIGILALRAGYRTEASKGLSALAGFSTGLGLRFWGHELAYAWLPYGDLGDTHYISMALRFGERKDSKRNLIRYQNIRHHQSVERNPQQSDPEQNQLMQLLQTQEKETLAGQPVDLRARID